MVRDTRGSFVGDILKAIDEMTPSVEAMRQWIDHNRRLPTALVSVMSDAKLFSLWLPIEFDGPELDLVGTARVIEAAARADGAMGWCAGIGTSYSRFAAFLPSSTAQQLFTQDRAIIAGTLPPMGRAVVVRGGYRVSGRWTFASGIQHAQWCVGGCMVISDGSPRLDADGVPETRTAFFPIGSVEVVDTWDVGGLRGTGSHDFEATDIFVPDEFTVAGLGVMPTCAGAFYRIPPHTAFPVLISAVPLGIARTALEVFKAMAINKTPVGGTTILRDKPTVQAAVGRAEAILLSARAFLLETCEQIGEVVAEGEPLSTQHRALMRLAGAQVAAASKETVQTVYELGGGTSVYESSGIQRCFRDIHAAVQHIQVQSGNFESAGRVLLGLDPGTSRF
jgi:alkylation response protein AidB-like acyl-CoA dehydrogenase